MYIFIFLKGMSCGDLIQYCIETCYGTCYLLSKGRDQDNFFINISIGSEIPLQQSVGIFIYFLWYKFSYWLFAYRYKLNLIFYKKKLCFIFVRLLFTIFLTNWIQISLYPPHLL